MEYSPSATVGETGYWGNKYGNSDVSNRFQIWNWKSKNGRYAGNLGGKYYYPITNKDTGDVEVSVFSDPSYSPEEGVKKSVYTFTSDSDIKTIIETLRWARVKSLTAQGYTVVM